MPQLVQLPHLRELDLRLTRVTRFRLARLLPRTKWKKIKLETNLDIGNREEREVTVFTEFCHEHDVLVEVEFE